ncbi:WhiB family transcriptional regulator [Streptomyces scabiei]|uniref:WhiB family transcriptional regulator n=2 Tax=Streptomyces scabiei TaxID=1930 RepID=UPI0029A94465|nr:WhiB family transcriptional regulator [Streptomyces scabiei]MDX2800172.1 WhiB family transcriptional regulator [Streptomyces scabiei]MDX3125837.1 WhiB family transcriptional regulator [Streptomyces scabiei]
MTGTDPQAAYRAWTEHPFYRYRGCAPDPDNPHRAQGDTTLSLDAWHGPDTDGGEGGKVRRTREEAAKRVCRGCPVREWCDAYASSVVGKGETARLAEPRGVWGGRTALERHRQFIDHRHEVAAAAPTEHLQTDQKQNVLQALAVHTDPWAVAHAAGVDWRTASWQRSRLVTQFSLDRAHATRRELLRVAVERGLLDARVVVGDDGSVPAVPAPLPRVRGRAARGGRARVRSASLGWASQLSFDDALEPGEPRAPAPPVLAARSVVALYPSAVCLEAVA